MTKVPRYYYVLAFLPLILAAIALLALFIYQRGAEERRDASQRPERILDALGVSRGSRVAEWRPEDTYFLDRLLRRVGREGTVYAVAPRRGVAEDIREELPAATVVSEIPSELDGLLLLLLRSAKQDRDELREALAVSHGRLSPTGRVAVIGVDNPDLSGFIRAEEAAAAGSEVGFHSLRRDALGERQYLLILAKRAEGSSSMALGPHPQRVILTSALTLRSRLSSACRLAADSGSAVSLRLPLRVG